MVGFLYFAFLDSKEKIKFTPQLYVIAAITLNPIIKIPFGRNTWQIIDVILSVVLLFSIYFESKLRAKKQKREQPEKQIISDETYRQETQPQKRIISEEEYQQAKERVKKYLDKREEQ